MTRSDKDFMQIAVAQARLGVAEGGLPIGACLTLGDEIVSEGRNRYKQEHNALLHAETDCVRNAGLFKRWTESTLYTTMSPCIMCCGAVLRFAIPRVVIGDATTFGGNEDFLRARGVEVVLDEDPELIAWVKDWIAKNPNLWRGDIEA